MPQHINVIGMSLSSLAVGMHYELIHFLSQCLLAQGDRGTRRAGWRIQSKHEAR